MAGVVRSTYRRGRSLASLDVDDQISSSVEGPRRGRSATTAGSRTRDLRSASASLRRTSSQTAVNRRAHAKSVHYRDQIEWVPSAHRRQHDRHSSISTKEAASQSARKWEEAYRREDLATRHRSIFCLKSNTFEGRRRLRSIEQGLYVQTVADVLISERLNVLVARRRRTLEEYADSVGLGDDTATHFGRLGNLNSIFESDFFQRHEARRKQIESQAMAILKASEDEIAQRHLLMPIVRRDALNFLGGDADWRSKKDDTLRDIARCEKFLLYCALVLVATFAALAGASFGLGFQGAFASFLFVDQYNVTIHRKLEVSQGASTTASSPSSSSTQPSRSPVSRLMMRGLSSTTAGEFGLQDLVRFQQSAGQLNFAQIAGWRDRYDRLSYTAISTDDDAEADENTVYVADGDLYVSFEMERPFGLPCQAESLVVNLCIADLNHTEVALQDGLGVQAQPGILRGSLAEITHQLTSGGQGLLDEAGTLEGTEGTMNIPVSTAGAQKQPTAEEDLLLVLQRLHDNGWPSSGAANARIAGERVDAATSFLAGVNGNPLFRDLVPPEPHSGTGACIGSAVAFGVAFPFGRRSVELKLPFNLNASLVRRGLMAPLAEECESKGYAVFYVEIEPMIVHTMINTIPTLPSNSTWFRMPCAAP